MSGVTNQQTYPELGYLERAPLKTRIFRRRADSPAPEVDDRPNPLEDYVGTTLDEPQDSSSLVVDHESTATEPCTLTLYVCWSPTYHVPVLYFMAHKQNGAPLELSELFNSTIFQHIYYKIAPDTSEPAALTSESDDPPPPAPFISQADHPTLGVPTWFLHPCNTQAIIQEVLCEDQGSTTTYFDTWLMVVGSVVDLRE
ncbi:BZ3500_MvSof-1268-A1-R1_Chr2-1g04513 [Microbotryum saponariae]|uniref:Ubiquitin-like-conjugating enzyme ATG10 n=1 Tax=Microbotryum saponariae TaxID=289078 RepID=A0A2X0MA35_9BASI|nr:BZ3500_MvSof-1268-A1-R1_Chr2-1g04513 [Microbotryum saponariae]SCZ91888.1 BZ3501_MvSof-1269-A2-R1_Chr2-1g04169 [Microbotryum saponariae]